MLENNNNNNAVGTNMSNDDDIVVVELVEDKTGNLITTVDFSRADFQKLENMAAEKNMSVENFMLEALRVFTNKS